ncbi:lysylphosphatidylglycerol synthase domain-containing protein [Cyanothece sp. BG0011]|uniref:lysylphosphatidylglycerol synthase domain-containing protein n=1 Tax=Cyanothece sp. BG0011 TaxID=2082950 RepID=UPI000D1F5E26|nr:lysylphosphatidylglycerol synthase domain-containing protein [Cyanothece sp. BG0011]
MVRRYIKYLPVFLAIALLTLSIVTISHEFKDHNPAEILRYLSNLNTTHKIGVIALTSLGYFIMTGYDFLGFHYIDQYLKRSKIIMTAFISYAVGNTIGFTAFSGTAIRYRFYGSWGVSKVKIAQLIIFTHLTFWVGLLGVGGVVFLIDPLSLPKILNLPFQSAHPIGFVFLVLVSIYFIISFFRKQPFKMGSELIYFPSPKISLASICIAAMDWGVASGVLYLLLPLSEKISFPGFFGIYILGLTAGLISSVPGGLGVFETVILLSLPNTISQADILGGLIAYRGIYYFLPLVVAIFLLIIKEVQQQRS